MKWNEEYEMSKETDRSVKWETSQIRFSPTYLPIKTFKAALICHMALFYGYVDILYFVIFHMTRQIEINSHLPRELWFIYFSLLRM